jgi:hypothetical protein
MKKLLFLLFLFPLTSFAQVTDDFSDADFAHNPAWTGDTLQFQISNYSSSLWSVKPRLQLDGSLADTSSLSVASSMANLANKEWDFWVRLAFNTSKLNNCRVYLISDVPNLEGSLNGYFVQFGDDNNDQWDSISLYRQNGATVQKIIAGHGCFTGASSSYRIKVERDNAGNWLMYADAIGGNNLVLIGSGFDNSVNISAYFGVFCKYTSTNKTNFYFDDIYAGPLIVDTIAPEVTSIYALSENEIELRFSEAVEVGTAENTANYVVAGLGSPLTAIKDNSDPTLVHLTFATVFTEGINYILGVSGVKDNSGNTMITASLPFVYYNAKPYDVVINEIMADPDPPVGLPNFEYLEIKNRTPYNLNLKDWTLTIGTSDHTFPEISIPANAYIIITDDNTGGAFDVYGPNLPFSSFSLTNTGSSILLKDQNDKLIHYIKYSDSWYRDNAKKDGGWSLEQIDAGNPCGEAGNWIASANISGGTPGSQNSLSTLNPDTLSPQISDIKITDPSKVEILLNEPLGNETMLDPAGFMIDNGIGSPVGANLISPDNKKIILLLSNPLQQNILYTLSYSDTIFDCAGNYMAHLSKTFVMYTARPYDIVINEIMADPDPAVGLPDIEYLELYNRTDFPISLSGWKLSLSGYHKSFPDITLQAKEYLIVSSVGSAPSFAPYGPVAEISGFSLTNTGEVVELLDTMQHVISFVNYSDNWYLNSSKDDGGWSLERIDPDNPCGELSNWKVSNDPGGGTPGKINSVDAANADHVSPVLVRASANRYEPHCARIYFDKPLDSIQMKVLTKYTVDHSMGNPYLMKLSWPDNKIITLYFSMAFQQNIVYTLTVSDSIFDCAGNKMTANSTARFALPELPDSADMVINEVLFNPKDDGVDFVEIYNRSQKVLDYKDMTLSSESGTYNITNDNYLSFPGDYTLLSTHADKVKSQYYTPNPNGFITMTSFPSLLNEEGSVALMTHSDTIIDAMSYTSSMHFPLLTSMEGVSLERIDFNRPASDLTNWHSAAQSVGFATPAYRNSQFAQGEADDAAITIQPEIFSPDNDGYNDVLNISCKTTGPGQLLSITIYDAKGRLIKYLLKSRYISDGETFSWDGTRDNGQKANMGIYIIYAELFDEKGKVKHYRRTAVLATKL